MTVTQTRFVQSTLAIVILGGLSFYAIAKGDAVTAPLAVPFIGAVAGMYTYGKTKNNDTYMAENTNPKNPL